ncbi:universal stress protein [Actinomadura sp. DC4]|uniref:universal stress protein n=1 Tax=Actinomadura sp. DC4 TaxID=3055069 RepID=UPI0025AF22AA|nr:universal stress protein [Actinomadura sp. DC4]MDN3351471.1 universal stress protein [Actinomadura sp. DC4]
MYERILVAVDWSATTEAVLDHTRRLAALTGAAVHVLHVRTTEFPSVPQMLGDLANQALAGGPTESDAGGAARRMVEDAAAALAAEGIGAEGLLLESAPGDTPQAVLDQARAFDADLIVLGARNHTRPSALFRSNVADEVTRQAKCPVLIVP